LILDEPTSGLDPEGAGWFSKSFAKNGARGRTGVSQAVIFVGRGAHLRRGRHDPSGRVRLFGRDRVIRDGQARSGANRVSGFNDTIPDQIASRARVQSSDGDTAVLLCQAADNVN